MRNWVVDKVARVLPLDVRIRVLLEELAKTPRDNVNAMATPVEEVLRHMRGPEDDMSDMFQRYRTDPEFVEAIPITPATIDIAANWCGGVIVQEHDPFDNSKTFVGLNVPTVSGVLRASEGDYVVRTQDGKFNVYQQRMFREKFKPVKS